MADTDWIDTPNHRDGGGRGGQTAQRRGGGDPAAPAGQVTVRGEASPQSSPATESTPSSSSVPMRQLEFTQAMNDFHHMFPSMDREVIEAVLRANHGIVDATIDQLLTMSIDNSEDDDDLPDHILMSVQRDVALESVNENTHSHKHKSQSSRLSKQEDPSMEESPPSYTEAIKSPHVMTTSHRHHGHHHHHGNRSSPPQRRGSPRHHPHQSQPPASGALLDLGVDELALSNTEAKTPLPPWEGLPSPRHTATLSPRHSTDLSDSPSKRGWGDTSTSQSKRSMLKASSRHHRASHMGVDGEGGALTHKPQHHHHRKVSWDTAALPARSKSFGGADSKRSFPHHHRHTSGTDTSPRKLPPYRNWNPPMLGSLPEDFLRLKPKVPQRIPLMTQKSDPSHRKTASAAFHRSLSSQEDSVDGTSHRRSHSNHTPMRSMSFAAPQSWSGMPQRIMTQDISTDFIQRRMRENERRRRQASVDLDPELSQYLEDERLALILQNSEFLQELRDDETFMKTLERDRQVAADEYASAQELKQQARIAAAAAAAAADPDSAPHLSPPVLAPEDQEGYGDDRQETLEAFPFSQQLPKANEDDAEFLQKLRHMGKASKKQFAALARRFFSRKRKKSPRHLLRESIAPSMTNLLDEEEVEEFDDETLGTSPSTYAPTSGAGRSGFRVDGLPPPGTTDLV